MFILVYFHAVVDVRHTWNRRSPHRRRKTKFLNDIVKRLFYFIYQVAPNGGKRESNKRKQRRVRETNINARDQTGCKTTHL